MLAFKGNTQIVGANVDNKIFLQGNHPEYPNSIDACCESRIVNKTSNVINLNDIDAIENDPNTPGAIQFDRNNFLNNGVPINSFADLLTLANVRICLGPGIFEVDGPVTIRSGSVLVLEDNTTLHINYTNADDRGIVMNERGSSIIGSGSNDKAIISFGPSISKGIFLGSNTTVGTEKTVKGIEIIGSNIPPTQGAPVTSLNGAIYLESTPGTGCIGSQGIWSNAGNQSTFFNTISDVKISGFLTAIRLFGQSNANFISNIEINNIYEYGIWMTGCFDNTIQKVDIKNSDLEACIRIDGYLYDDMFSGPCQIGGQDLSNNFSFPLLRDTTYMNFDTTIIGTDTLVVAQDTIIQDLCFLTRSYNNGFWDISFDGCYKELEVKKLHSGNICDELAKYIIPELNIFSFNNTPCSQGYEVDDFNVDPTDTDFQSLLDDIDISFFNHKETSTCNGTTSK